MLEERTQIATNQYIGLLPSHSTSEISDYVSVPCTWYGLMTDAQVQLLVRRTQALVVRAQAYRQSEFDEISNKLLRSIQRTLAENYSTLTQQHRESLRAALWRIEAAGDRIVSLYDDSSDLSDSDSDGESAVQAAVQAAVQPADQLANVRLHLDGLDIKYKEPYPGILITHGFGEKILGIDPAAVLDGLMKAPVRRAGDTIRPGELQWVDGDNENLRYRGNVLRRMKIWLQDGPPNGGTLIYSYTGYTFAVAPATSDWNAHPELAAMCQRYNKFISMIQGAPAANHAIVTAYADGKCSIGMHSDKTHSLHDDTIIGVLKLGGASRRFCIRKRILNFPAGIGQAQKTALQNAEPMLLDEDVASGDLILMTGEANNTTQHGVPELETADAVALSGSIVWRTAAQRLSPEELEKKIAVTEKGRAKRKAAKSSSKRDQKRERS